MSAPVLAPADLTASGYVPVFSTVEQRRTALRTLAIAADDLPPVVVRLKVWEWADRRLTAAERDKAWEQLLEAVTAAHDLHCGAILAREFAPGNPELAPELAEQDIVRALTELVAS